LGSEVGFKGMRECQLAQWLNFAVQLGTVNFKKNPIAEISFPNCA
jgi:hypothetical protein